MDDGEVSVHSSRTGGNNSSLRRGSFDAKKAAGRRSKRTSHRSARPSHRSGRSPSRGSHNRRSSHRTGGGHSGSGGRSTSYWDDNEVRDHGIDIPTCHDLVKNIRITR